MTEVQSGEGSAKGKPEMSGQTSELIDDEDFLQSVSICGRLLGPLFLKRPDTDECKTVANAMLAQPFVESWPFGDKDRLAEAYAAMLQGYAAAQEGDEGMAALRREYERLFIGPNIKPAPPWGSVYLDKDCVVFGVSLLDLRRWMRQNDVRTLYSEKEPEDHIGRMFELMATLADERPELLPEFLQDHLLTWSSHFLDELADSTDNGFYRGLAGLANTTLLDLCDLLELDVPVKRFYR